MSLLGPDGQPLGEHSNEVEDLRARLTESIYTQRLLERDSELLAWHVLNADRPGQDMEVRDRIKLARVARDVWTRDPQAGAAADLLNDFVFGRGVPRPRCRDEKVQEIVDEAWDDPDNQIVLTSYAAQLEKGLDLTLQSNVYLLAFTGDDGKVKLSMLEHDTVDGVVRDPENRLRILWYRAKVHKYDYDFENDREKTLSEMGPLGKPKVEYYGHWRNVDDSKAAGDEMPTPPDSKLGEGLVYHISINKTSEMAFGIPTMRRLMRWFSAYNEFMSSRVDVAKAAAAFIMKRRVKGGESAVQRIAQQRLNRESVIANADIEDLPLIPPPPGSILNENDSVVHEALNLQTNAGNAQQDGQQLRSQISAATHWPQHYLGDAGSANLATATSMELPVLKHVEGRQEVWEGVYRWFIDLVIRRAVEAGRLSGKTEDPNQLETALVEASTSKGTQRDLSYEFALPSPLKRMMADLVNSVANIAKTFDPNGTNIALSRILLLVALRDGLEVQDAPKAVEEIFPKGYVDPAIAAFQAQQQAQQDPAANGSPSDTGGTRGVNGQQPNQTNPYGGPAPSSPNTPAVAGDASGNPYGSNRGVRSRRPEEIQQAVYDAETDAVEILDRDLMEIAEAELVRAELMSANGNGNGNGKH